MAAPVITDPKWLLEILRAGGWKSAGFAAGCFITIALVPLPDWLRPIITGVGIVSSCLMAAALLEHAVRRYDPEKAILDWLEWRRWRRRLRALPNQARAVLSVMEEDGLDWVYYDPRSDEISALRGQDVLEVELTGTGGVWAKFSLSHSYLRAYSRRRSMFRAELKCPDAASARVRIAMSNAQSAAHRP